MRLSGLCRRGGRRRSGCVPPAAQGRRRLTELEYALDAEAAGAAFLAVLPADDAKLQAILNKIVPMVESRPGAGALALMRVLGSVACGVRPRVATVASAVADRMAKAGVSEPRWAAEVAEPVEVSDCARLYDGSGVLTFLSATFQRAGREHSFVVIVEQTHCGAAADIIVTGDQQLPGLMNSIRNSVLGGRTLGRQELTPAEFRWYAEDALGLARRARRRGSGWGSRAVCRRRYGRAAVRGAGPAAAGGLLRLRSRRNRRVSMATRSGESACRLCWRGSSAFSAPRRPGSRSGSTAWG